jgi:hypothetical protein
MVVKIEDGYAKVYHKRVCICAGEIIHGRLCNIEFMDPSYMNNKTRQAACRALQKVGF